MNWSAIVEVVLKLFMKLLVPFLAYKAGEEEVKKDATLKALEEMRDAKALQERLDSDPDFAKRVRDEYR